MAGAESELVNQIKSARHVVVFTGAGLSARSGISTFHESGIWDQYSPEHYARWSNLLNMATTKPRHFARFAIEFLAPIAKAEPNAAHHAIANLERQVTTTIVTQNIDGLQQQVGSLVVRELNGTCLETIDVLSRRFQRLITRRDLQKVVKRIRKAIPRKFIGPRIMLALRPLAGPGIKGAHRPNLLLFGDSFAEPAWEQSLEAARKCDVMICVGTASQINPASALPAEARTHGAQVFAIEPQEPAGDAIWVEGEVDEVLPRIVAALQ